MKLLENFVDFLNQQKNKPSFSTIKNYKADIGQFISWVEKEIKTSFDPSKINLETLEKYKASRKLSHSSAKRHISSLRKFINFLKSKGHIDPKLIELETHANTPEPDPWKLRNYKNFLNEYKKSKLTIKNYINDMKNFFALYENLNIHIDAQILSAYEKKLIDLKFSNRTIKRKISSLKNYIAWAKKQGLIKSLEDKMEKALDQEFKTTPINNSTSNTSQLPYYPMGLPTEFSSLHKRTINNLINMQPKNNKLSYAFNFVLFFIFSTIIFTSLFMVIKNYIFPKNETDTKSSVITQNTKNNNNLYLNNTKEPIQYFKPIDPTIDDGDVVVLDNLHIKRSDSSYQENIIGVVAKTSENDSRQPINSIPVYINGETLIKISFENGPIQANDLLTSSSVPGVAMKSNEAGKIVGKSLENLDNINDPRLIGFYDPTNNEYREKDDLANIPLKPDIIRIYKIYALSNPSLNEPKKQISKETIIPEQDQTINLPNIFTNLLNSLRNEEIISPLASEI